ncbi:MAG: TrmB family transcriptional regulator [Thaumarchaeota archaeon CSP1-1]|nr:MAG: TrmB family transcriptional regulator [Thaumarchaeota archaeon CSP1-1]
MENQELILPEEEEVMPLLADYGLTEEEARVYVGVLRIGTGKVSEISHFTNTDRVKGYKILENLRSEGYVTSTLSSPILFSANDPKTTFDTILTKKKSGIQRLEKNQARLIENLEKLKGHSVVSNLPKLSVISGRDNIYNEIKKIIDETKDEMYLVTSTSDLIRMYYTDIPAAIKKALKRKVEIKLMTEFEVSDKTDCVKNLGLNYFKVAKLPSQGRIVCNSSQIIMSGYTSKTSRIHASDDSALVTNSDEITSNMQSLCKFMWKMGGEVKIDKKGTVEGESPRIKTGVQKNATALVVDDDPDTVEMFSDYLENKGVNVIGKAKDGKEGFELYKKLKPDVIFLDVIMPNYDGFYTLKKIREIDADAKIIMVTADFSPTTKKKLKELKATDIIYKPYDGRAIDRVI